MSHRRFLLTADHTRPGASAPQPGAPAGFMVLPVPTAGAPDFVAALYRWAYERAQATVRPAPFRHDLFAAMN